MASTWAPFQPTAQNVRAFADTNAKRRRLSVFLDQHRSREFPEGRAWWGFVEKPAGDDDLHPGVVAELVPVAVDSVINKKQYRGWQAPWYPDSKYINDAISTAEGNHFEINYRRMEMDYRTSEDAYYQRAIQAALSNKLDVPKLGGAISWEVRAIVGAPPKSSRIPRAALTGHAWLLGFSTEVDETLQRLLDPTSGMEDIATMAEHRQASNEMDDLRAQIAQMQRTLAQFAKDGAEFDTPDQGKPKRRGPSPEHMQRMRDAKAEKQREGSAVTP